MMKTSSSNSALGLAIIALCLVPPPVAAKVSDLLEMSERMDQADKQDFQGALGQANSCTRARNFSCSEEQLRKAAKLVNGSSDKQALNAATQNLQAERQRVKDEATAKAERERQIWLANEREAEERRAAKKRREREEAEEDAAASRRNASSQLQQSQRDLDALITGSNRQLQANTNRAFQQQRDQAAARQRDADDARAAESERTRRQNQRAAQPEQDRADQQERARQQEQARQREQERVRQANAAAPTTSSSYGEVRKKNRCQSTFSASSSGKFSEEQARSEALRYAHVNGGGPDNKLILSSTVTSCKHEEGIGYLCSAVTKYEVDTDGPTGSCNRGPSSGISR
jgi:hypothetical protein